MRRFFRAAALLTAVSLLCAPLLPAAAAADIVTIATVQELADFAKSCTRDTWSQGITVELTADLDLSGSGIEPVPIFQGTFHGNGHTISGFTFEKKGSKVGLFRTLTQSAVVEDLIVEGTLEPQGSAGQAGLLAGENFGTVRGCTARGQVAAQEDVGGLVGLNGEGGSLIACASDACVSGVTNVGGLVGQNLGTVERCTNRGAINVAPDQETPTNVGGIAGLSRGTVQGCANAGAVGYQHVGYNMGGIAGLQSGEISQCANTASIQGRKDVGGLVGQFEPSTSLTYGLSPSQQLNDSLSGLFDELERFTNQINGIVDRGVEDAQAIHDSLSAIQNRTHAAGTEGREDFQAMSDELYQNCVVVSDSLDSLRESLGRFTDRGSEQLQEALDQSDRLLSALADLVKQADSSLGQAIHALEDTVSRIRAQLQAVHTHRQAMESELEELEAYLTQVIGLVAEGKFQEALELPLPSLDPLGHMKAILDGVKQAASLAASLPGQWSAVHDNLSQALRESGRDIDRSLSRLYDALTALNQAGEDFSASAQEALEEVSLGMDRIRDLLKDYTDTLGDKAQSAVDDIDRELTAIQDRFEDMTQAADADNDALHASSQAILDRMEAVRQAITNLNREPELTATDLTDEVDQGPGLVMGCTVSGTVEGDSNVGGIVGTVSAELGDDPEATFDLGDVELMSDVYATLRAVIRGCRFDGAVTVKNECGGGIAGRCAAGAILDCVARGAVETGGDYCGGIVGRTRGTVVRCAALTDLTGQSWLGGVAGLGEDLTGCRSMVRAQGEGEYWGAVAGQAEGTLSGNFYLLEELAGVDGVDYQDTAQGLEFEAFSQLENIPADFLSFSYRFEVDGQTVAEIPFAYGEDLDLSQVPQAPQRGDQYGQWPQFPTENLRRSMALTAQFAAPTSTLADQDGVAGLLVEGTFAPDAVLTVHQEELPAKKVEGCTPHCVWSYAVTGSQSSSLTVRIRAEGVKRPEAAVYEDGAWRQVDSTLDGSYLVFSGPAEGKVMLMEGPSSIVWAVALAGAGAAVLLGGGLWLRRRRHAGRTAATKN